MIFYFKSSVRAHIRKCYNEDVKDHLKDLTQMPCTITILVYD